MGQPSMCFALNGNIFNPEVKSVQGVMNCYTNSLQKFHLHGPTNFAPIINQVADFVASKDDEQSQYN